MRTLKEDLVWLYDGDNPFDFQASLVRWINDYNNDFPHQSLRYMTPKEYFVSSMLKKGL